MEKTMNTVVTETMLRKTNLRDLGALKGSGHQQQRLYAMFVIYIEYLLMSTVDQKWIGTEENK